MAKTAIAAKRLTVDVELMHKCTPKQMPSGTGAKTSEDRPRSK